MMSKQTMPYICISTYNGSTKWTMNLNKKRNVHRITENKKWVLQMWKVLQKPKRLFSHLSSLHIYLVHCLLGNIPHFFNEKHLTKSKALCEEVIHSSIQNIFPEHSNGLQVRSQSSFRLSLRTTSCKQTRKKTCGKDSDLWPLILKTVLL